MAERLFCGVLLATSLFYLYFAFFTISAPIQYDPLGPETWPRILGLMIAAALAVRLVRPTGARLAIERRTLWRLAAVVALMAAYAVFFERLGFILSTWAFCAAVTLMLGAALWKALAFGAAVGFGGFFLFTILLDLKLPGGPLGFGG